MRRLSGAPGPTRSLRDARSPRKLLASAGATCAHLLSGNAPDALFDKLFHIVIPADVPLTLGFRRWLDRMIDPDPTQRFADAAEALAELERGFLMRPMRREVPLPPDPGRPPRPAPGFHYRDPAAGRSYVFNLAIGGAAVLLTVPAVVAGFASPTPPLGGMLAMATVAAAGLLAGKWRSARDAIAAYRRWEHAVGEVTRAYAGGGLEYRYMAAGVMRDGHLRTRCAVLTRRRAGDPIAVLYDPDDPDRSRAFIG